MTVDLIIDGNYILSKNTFTLHKNNLLFGALHKSLEVTINNYRKWYPFANVYLVSDSKEKSWRKQLTTAYKATRKKDSDIEELKTSKRYLRLIVNAAKENNLSLDYINELSQKSSVYYPLLSELYSIVVYFWVKSRARKVS